jgi:hypothetical protein
VDTVNDSRHIRSSCCHVDNNAISLEDYYATALLMRNPFGVLETHHVNLDAVCFSLGKSMSYAKRVVHWLDSNTS